MNELSFPLSSPVWAVKSMFVWAFLSSFPQHSEQSNQCFHELSFHLFLNILSSQINVCMSFPFIFSSTFWAFKSMFAWVLNIPGLPWRYQIPITKVGHIALSFKIYYASESKCIKESTHVKIAISQSGQFGDFWCPSSINICLFIPLSTESPLLQMESYVA